MALRGYRFFTLRYEDDRLALNGCVWSGADYSQPARCVSKHDHPVPNADCGCGYYAWYRPEDADTTLGVAYGHIYSRRIPATVWLYGDMVIGERGMQAARMQTEYLHLPACSCGQETALYAVQVGEHRRVKVPSVTTVVVQELTLDNLLVPQVEVEAVPEYVVYLVCPVVRHFSAFIPVPVAALRSLPCGVTRDAWPEGTACPDVSSLVEAPLPGVRDPVLQQSYPKTVAYLQSGLWDALRNTLFQSQFYFGVEVKGASPIQSWRAAEKEATYRRLYSGQSSDTNAEFSKQQIYKQEALRRLHSGISLSIPKDGKEEK